MILTQHESIEKNKQPSCPMPVSNGGLVTFLYYVVKQASASHALILVKEIVIESV